MITIVKFYAIAALMFFCIWLGIFWSDRRTPRTDLTSWLVLLLATLFWPIAVPMALLELADTKGELSGLDPHVLPLGQLLQQAGLISEAQVEQALAEQQTQLPNLRLGEILARRGWIQQETADFFVDGLPRLPSTPRKRRLGEYLQAAKLLSPEQIDLILAEQPQTKLRFGEIAVRKGWIEQETLDLILFYLTGDGELAYQS